MISIDLVVDSGRFKHWRLCKKGVGDNNIEIKCKGKGVFKKCFFESDSSVKDLDVINDGYTVKILSEDGGR